MQDRGCNVQPKQDDRYGVWLQHGSRRDGTQVIRRVGTNFEIPPSSPPEASSARRKHLTEGLYRIEHTSTVV